MNIPEPVESLKSTATDSKYDEYENSGVEWLGKIPVHWEVVRAEAFLNRKRDSLSSEDLDEQQVFHYSIPVIDETGDGRVEEGNKIGSSKTRLSGGELLVSKLNPRKSRVLLSEPKDRLSVCSNEFVVMEPDGCHPKFAKYLYSAEHVRQYLDSMVQSATRSHQRANPDDITKMKAGWPPLDEQRAIAAYLDRETERIDALIEKKERLIDLLEEKRTALISRVVTEGLDENVDMQDSGVEWLGEIPAHWETGKVAHLLENLDSQRIPVSASDRADMQGEYPYYGASGVIDHVDDYLFDEPLILVAEDGANLFSRSSPLAFVARGKYWVNNHAHILRPRYEPLEYWAYVLRSIVYDPWITGAAQPKLTQENLDSIELPMPPKDDRVRITEKLNEERSEINALIERVEDGIERLKEYRTALISAAVTGQIDVRETIEV